MKIFTNFTIAIIIANLLTSIVYFCGSFYQASFFINSWTQETRLFISCAMFIVWSFSWGITLDRLTNVDK